MRCASTWMPEKWTQTPSPSPDLFPAQTLTRNSHSDWHCEWGHFIAIAEAKRKTPEVFPSPRVRFGGAERGIMPEISQASNQLHAVQTTCRNR